MNLGNEGLSSNSIMSRAIQSVHLRILLVILVIGLASRVAVTIHGGWATPPVPGSDASEYDEYAWNLIQGRGYSGVSPDVNQPDGRALEHSTAYRVPGTSVFWAGLYEVFGHRYNVVRISQCLLDTLTILLLYGIGRKCFSDTVALLSAALYAVWPMAFQYSSQLGSEPLYAFLFCCVLLASLRFAEHPSWSRSIAAGVLLGLALLTRGNAVLMVALLVPWSVWQFRKTPRLMVRGLAISFVALVVLTPWTLRNYSVFHAFIPFETGGGDVALGSYNRIVASNPLYYGYWVYPTSELPEYRAQITAPNNEVVRDHVETQLAMQWARRHPEKWWYLAESRFRRSWTPFLQPSSPCWHDGIVGTCFDSLCAWFLPDRNLFSEDEPSGLGSPFGSASLRLHCAHILGIFALPLPGRRVVHSHRERDVRLDLRADRRADSPPVRPPTGISGVNGRKQIVPH